MNHAANARFALEALNDGHLDMPVLFLEAAYDYTCDCVNSPLTEPMKKLCRDLTIERIAAGHWMAQERPIEVNASLARWLGAKVPQAWRY
jgi:pimeloyl-ACP methyl ester carboxylesterase